MGIFDGLINKVNSGFDILFMWSVNIHPVFGIVFISFLLTLISTLAYKYLTNQEALKKLKEDHKSLRDEIEKHKNNPAKAAELQKQLLHKSFMEPMSHQIKPMIATFLPFILVLGWLSKVYKGVDLNLWFIHNWFWAYFIIAIIFSSVLRKLFKVH